MTIRSRIRRRTTTNWVLAIVGWLATVGVAWLLAHSAWLTGGVAAISLFIIWRLVAGPATGPVVSKIQEWIEDFKAIQVERPISWEEFGHTVVGVGSYGHQVLPMRVAVTADGLVVELGQGVSTIRINWNMISLLRVGKYRLKDDIQPIVEVFLRDVKHKPLVLPWNECYQQAVPSYVGVDSDLVEVRVLG